MIILYSVSDDYDAVTMNVTLSTSNKIVSTFISIVNDETVELNEYFFVRIEAFIGPVEFVRRETEIVILNDDGNQCLMWILCMVVYRQSIVMVLMCRYDRVAYLKGGCHSAASSTRKSGTEK